MTALLAIKPDSLHSRIVNFVKSYITRHMRGCVLTTHTVCSTAIFDVKNENFYRFFTEILKLAF